MNFLDTINHPFVVVSTLLSKDREAVVNFLLELNVPVYLEGVSGIREDPRLSHLRVTYIHNFWENSRQLGYPIDGILRIGGVPTFKPWRDLEEKEGEIQVVSVTHLPFSGLSWGCMLHVDLTEYLSSCQVKRVEVSKSEWLEMDRECYRQMMALCQKWPRAEPSLVHSLSHQMPKNSLVYLGNSLPVREWDAISCYEDRGYRVFASRGVNGIDGQISTFLGLCRKDLSNWAIIGDLTALYDLAGPWILKQMQEVEVNLVILNNGGGMIFSRMFPEPEFQNPHKMNFKPFAKLWGVHYHDTLQTKGDSSHRMIELVPDPLETEQFWEEYEALAQEVRYV